MARKRSAGKGRRVTLDNSNFREIALPPSNHIQYLNKLIQHRRSAALREAEDRRRYNPSSFTPLDIYGRPVRRLVLKKNDLPWKPRHRELYRGPHLSPIRIVPHNSILAHRRARVGSLEDVMRERITFADPTKVMICVRRKQRKEVIFALGLSGGAGRAKKRFRKPRRNAYSGIDC